ALRRQGGPDADARERRRRHGAAPSAVAGAAPARRRASVLDGRRAEVLLDPRAPRRSHRLKRDLAGLADAEADLCVIGGGIYGAAIAREAALRGLSVALVERRDFGAATSANSHKIIHGGLRYLQHLDLPRLRESLRE